MLDTERTYADLIFRATKKYASWDPEVFVLLPKLLISELKDTQIPVKVGDYGRITKGLRSMLFWRKNGTFVREGNIYSDGKAKNRQSEGESFFTSGNVTRVDASLSGVGIDPALAQCQIKGAFKLSSGCGAVLAMESPMLTMIDPPGVLQRLLEDPSMRGTVVVSEFHSCSSYARLLTAETGGTIALGLKLEPPTPGVASVSASTMWVRSVVSGNFKFQVDKTGERTFYPLFRLVSTVGEEMSMGIGRPSTKVDLTPIATLSETSTAFS
ncbi:hypothetical protein DFH06DRAFT_1132860 [Mycena polygramma]|nr:hypothetical protein DFH06DRAFT_1132860 [Mycena polygramma]